MDGLIKLPKRGKNYLLWSTLYEEKSLGNRSICMLQMFVTVLTAGWVQLLKILLLPRLSCKNADLLVWYNCNNH